jgi:uridine kinase
VAAVAGETMEDVMGSAVGPHFSGLRLDSLRLSSSSLSPSSSPSRSANGDAAPGFASPKADGTRRPFVIGACLDSTRPAGDWLAPLSLCSLWIFRLSGFEFWCRFFPAIAGFEGVCGGTASGKTTVCDMIIQQLHDHRVVLVNQVRCCFSSSSDLALFLCLCVF